MDEDKLAQKIEKMELMRRAHMEQYHDPALKNSLEVLQFGIDIANQDVALKERQLTIAGTTAAVSVDNPHHYSQEVLVAIATNNLQISKLKANKAVDDLKKFQFAVSRALSMADAVQHYFAFEEAQLAERRERLKVISPIAGTLTLLCGIGSYAKHGNIVATVEI